jgi:hypothetical protein
MFSKRTVPFLTLTITTVTLTPELEVCHPQPMWRNVPSFLPPLRVKFGCRGSLKEGLHRSDRTTDTAYFICCFYTAVFNFTRSTERRDCSVGVFTSLRTGRPRNRGSIPDRFKRLFSPPERPDRLRGPASMLVNRYSGL